MTNGNSEDRLFSVKDWDTRFFGRQVVSVELNRDLTEHDWTKIKAEIAALTASGTWLVEARLKSSYFHNIPELERLGFRFVDSRLEFSTLTRRADSRSRISDGFFRWYRDSDAPSLERLTFSQFAGNLAFRSRYNNRRYFTQEESHRYYMQWHHWVLGNSHPLFCVWEVDQQFAGFYSIVRQVAHQGPPNYKVALAAVEPKFRSLGAQNQMQFWIFENAPDEEWFTINSPALTNLSGLKNNIRAAKELSYVEAYMFLELS